jgi:two-component system cell cycle sensor histidine kinase PleC
MARARSARGGFAFAEPHWQDLRALAGRYLPNGERLRRLVPLLLAAFAIVAILGFALQLIHGKSVAFDSASRQLSLIADNAALNLKHETLGSSATWQSALAASLPKGATADRRVALLADAEGQIQGRAPLDGSPSGNLLTILGPQQPLTTFGADAGVLRLTLLDGTDAIVTVRNVPQTDAQLAFIQPVSDALADWRQAARLEITLLVLTGLVLALLAGGLWYLAPVAARNDAGVLTRELTEALPGCGVWRWNLARGHVQWSAPMYRLLGLAPSDKPWRSGSSPRHCTRTTICAARSTDIFAMAHPCSTVVFGCAMPTEGGWG